MSELEGAAALTDVPLTRRAVGFAVLISAAIVAGQMLVVMRVEREQISRVRVGPWPFVKPADPVGGRWAGTITTGFLVSSIEAYRQPNGAFDAFPDSWSSGHPRVLASWSHLDDVIVAGKGAIRFHEWGGGFPFVLGGSSVVWFAPTSFREDMWFSEFGVIANWVFWLVVMGLAPFTFAARVRRRLKRGVCPSCQYPLSTTGLCTECGRNWSPKSSGSAGEVASGATRQAG